MDNPVTWTLTQSMMMIAGVLIFGWIGFHLGVNRGLVVVIGVVLAMVLASQIAPGFIPKFNRYYKLGKLALSGGLGADDLGKAWDEAKAKPDLIKSPEDEQLFSLAIFALVVLCAWIIAHLVHRQAPQTVALRSLGALTGIVNGFLITYYLMPIIFPNPQTLISVPSGDVNKTLTSGQTVARMVAFFVFVLIAFGLYGSSGAKKKGGQR